MCKEEATTAMRSRRSSSRRSNRKKLKSKKELEKIDSGVKLRWHLALWLGVFVSNTHSNAGFTAGCIAYYSIV